MDLGRWVTAQRDGWEQLLPAQQWLLENVLGFGGPWAVSGAVHLPGAVRAKNRRIERLAAM
ncbi:hypothetical protein ABZY11_44050, partial [Streptomyces sp. NPDC006510]